MRYRSNFVFCSSYSYSGGYLVSVTVGNNTATYNYTSDGDLSEAIFSSGMRRTWGYDSNRLLCHSTVNSESGELLAALNMTNNLNGKATLTMLPKNSTNELVYDTNGAIISSTTDSDIMFTEVETIVPGSNTLIKSHMFGDQVRGVLIEMCSNVFVGAKKFLSRFWLLIRTKEAMYKRQMLMATRDSSLGEMTRSY